MTETRTQHYFLVALIIGALLLTFYIIRPFLAPLLLGVVFAVVLQPLYRRLTVRFGGRESLASLATVVIAIFLILIPMFFISFQILNEAQSVYETYSGGGLQGLVDRATGTIAPMADSVVPGSGDSIRTLSAQIDAYADTALSWLIQHLATTFSSVAGVVLDLFLFFMVLYFLLRDGRALKAYLIKLSPLADVDDEVISNRLENSVNTVVKGMLTIATIQGILAGIGFAIFGVPNPVLWGLVAGFAAVIPAFGTALVLAPAVAFLALTGSLFPAIGLAIWGALAVGMIDNLLSPQLMGRGMKLHPLLVLLSVLGGVSLFGPVGIFLGPLAVSFLLALLSLYTHISGAREEVSA